MADEVYKILQSRLRRNAQHTNCRDQQPDCDVYINTLSEDTNSHARKKTRVAPPGAEVKKNGTNRKQFRIKRLIYLSFRLFYIFGIFGVFKRSVE